MKNFYIVILIIFFVLPVCAQRTVITKQPLYNGYYKSVQSRNFDDIGDLEQYVFDKCYNNENNIQRLCRLETAVFGAIQNGDVYNRYENLRSVVFDRPKQNNNNSILKSLGNYFTGQLTGFTPPVYYNSQPQYNINYPSSFSNGSFTEFSSPYGTGYQYNNYSRGAHSSVRILD